MLRYYIYVMLYTADFVSIQDSGQAFICERKPVPIRRRSSVRTMEGPARRGDHLGCRPAHRRPAGNPENGRCRPISELTRGLLQELSCASDPGSTSAGSRGLIRTPGLRRLGRQVLSFVERPPDDRLCWTRSYGVWSLCGKMCRPIRQPDALQRRAPAPIHLIAHASLLSLRQAQ
jgi:hypothetical protein